MGRPHHRGGRGVAPGDSPLSGGTPNIDGRRRLPGGRLSRRERPRGRSAALLARPSTYRRPGAATTRKRERTASMRATGSFGPTARRRAASIVIRGNGPPHPLAMPAQPRPFARMLTTTTAEAPPRPSDIGTSHASSSQETWRARRAARRTSGSCPASFLRTRPSGRRRRRSLGAGQRLHRPVAGIFRGLYPGGGWST